MKTVRTWAVAGILAVVVAGGMVQAQEAVKIEPTDAGQGVTVAVDAANPSGVVAWFKEHKVLGTVTAIGAGYLAYRTVTGSLDEIDDDVDSVLEYTGLKDEEEDEPAAPDGGGEAKAAGSEVAVPEAPAGGTQVVVVGNSGPVNVTVGDQTATAAAEE